MGQDKVLIIKSKQGEKMSIKVRRKIKKGFTPDEYHQVCNPQDYKSLALLFEDLELVVGAPIDKAYKEFKSKKERGFPFF